MKEPEPVDLIHLADNGGNGLVVRVTGRFRAGVPAGPGVLRADVLISAGFVEARLDLCLPPRDLAAWERALGELRPGGTAAIGTERGPRLTLHHHDDQSVSVAVDDPDRFSTAFPIQSQPDWIEDHRRRLDRVRRAWPSEIIETAPDIHGRRPRHRT